MRVSQFSQCLVRHMMSMSMVSINNNKEFFELLDGTDSHSGCEVQQLVIPPRKKRFRRRLRNNPNTRHQEDSSDCRCSARTVSLTLFCVVIVSWLITLTWLAVVLHNDIYRLNSEMQECKYNKANLKLQQKAFQIVVSEGKTNCQTADSSSSGTHGRPLQNLEMRPICTQEFT